MIWSGLIAGVVVALAMQGTAELVARRLGGLPSIDQLGLYAVGVVLRFLGVLLVALLVLLDRERFPPVATTFGYLGTILPLLVLETRRRR